MIEKSLKRNKLKSISIYTEEGEYEPSHLPIYHVHGYLPREVTLTEEHRRSVVLSEQAYHNQFFDPYMWTNLSILYHFRNKVCLFIGLSMSDPNLRRLLELASSKSKTIKHYAIMISPWDKVIRENDSPKTKDFADTMKSLEHRSLQQLGVDIIWLERHEDIPDFLMSIKAD